MSIEQPRNSFRASLLGTRADGPILAGKKDASSRSSEGSMGLAVTRSEVRRSNSRDADRHRLSSAGAVIRKGRRNYQVDLINISGGGAMVEGDFGAKLWQSVTLKLGEVGELECAVRWIRGNRYGLEFAHETRIDCDPETLNETLRTVLSDCAPDELEEEPHEGEEEVAAAAAPLPRRVATRHPLIWSGLIEFSHETAVARIRNISATGVQIESQADYPVGAEVALDLGDAGTVRAIVCWSQGGHSGLKFRKPFDVRRLGLLRPTVAPRNWLKPDYLENDDSNTSPWASQWGRLTVNELKRTLGR